jgi:hypothetical protein
MVSDKKIDMGISHRVLCLIKFAVAAILVGGLKCRIQFWKETTQGSFQQSLVAIGPVVSEEKILCEFPIGSNVKLSSAVGTIYFLKGQSAGHIFGREPSNNYFIKI